MSARSELFDFYLMFPCKTCGAQMNYRCVSRTGATAHEVHADRRHSGRLFLKYSQDRPQA
jgi:hypothetical protein